MTLIFFFEFSSFSKFSIVCIFYNQMLHAVLLFFFNYFGCTKRIFVATHGLSLVVTHGLSCPYDQPRQHIKKQKHYFVNKGPSSQGYGFSSTRVWM